MKISNEDARTLDRLLDGALAPAEATALRARIAVEPALQMAFDERQRMHEAFAAAGARTFTPPSGFTAKVLGATRRLPSRREIEEQDVGASIVRICGRILIAAAVVIGLGFAWHVGIFGGCRDSRLEASPNELQKEVERLDAMIAADEAGGTKAK